MNKFRFIIGLAIFGMALAAHGATFDNLSKQAEHKTGLGEIVTEVNANFDNIETNLGSFIAAKSLPVTAISLSDGKVLIGDAGGTGQQYVIFGHLQMSNVGELLVTNAALVRATLDDAQSLTGMAAAGIVGYVALDANPGEITVTTNVPTFLGQWLIGTTSNDVWLSIGTTTNDWVVIQDPS